MPNPTFRVSSGIIEVKHVHNIGEAIWVYLWCLDKQTGRHGRVLGGKPVTYEAIGGQIGIDSRTVQRHIRRLENYAYLGSERTPKGLRFRILFQKKFGAGNDPSDKTPVSDPSGRSDKTAVSYPSKRDKTGVSHPIRQGCPIRSDTRVRSDKEVTPEVETPEVETPLNPQRGADEGDAWDCGSCVQILTLLNDLTARTYDGSGKGFSLLHAAHERHGRQSCVEVVQRKVEQWKDDPKRARFLRPETLFDPTHFDSYRNETDSGAVAPTHTQPKATKKDIEDLNRWRAKRGEPPIPLPENG